jgi:uncharacterized membrane protein
MITLAVSFSTALVALHVAAVVVAFGSLFVYPPLVAVVRRTSPGALGPLHRAQYTVARWITIPALVVVTVAGLYLAGDQKAFGKAWVIVPLALIVVLMAVHRGLLIRGYGRLAELGPRDGAPSPEYEALARRIERLELMSAALVLFAVYVMVAKPFT